jgi:hypothetical protein
MVQSGKDFGLPLQAVVVVLMWRELPFIGAKLTEVLLDLLLQGVHPFLEARDQATLLGQVPCDFLVGSWHHGDDILAEPFAIWN